LLLLKNKEPLTLALSPLRGARGPEQVPLRSRVLQEALLISGSGCQQVQAHNQREDLLTG